MYGRPLWSPRFLRAGIGATTSVTPTARNVGGCRLCAPALDRLWQINSAVHVNGLSGDVTPARRAQEFDRSGDVFRVTFATDQRMAAAGNDAPLAGIRRTRAADAPWNNAIHRDAVAAELNRQRLGEPDKAGFRGRDMGTSRGAGVPGYAANIDDGAAALGKHARNDGAAAEKRAIEHHGQHEAPVREAHGGECVVAP